MPTCTVTGPGATVEATYTDGRTARRHRVRATVAAGGLHIESVQSSASGSEAGASEAGGDRAEGAVAELWPFADLRLVDEVWPGRPFRLRRRGGAARLTIADGAFLDRLQRHAGQLRRKDLRRARLTRRAAVWIGATAAILAGFWFLLPRAAEPVAALVPLAWEESLGRAAHDQALALVAPGARRCTGAAGRRALEALTRRLAAARPSRYRFRVTVADSSIVNAFAAPGGHIVIFRGLIEESPDAEGLAGVLAHEMGHVVERHGLENIVKALGLSVVMAALIGDASSIAGIAAGMAQELVGAGFSRAAEREADRVAVAMLNRAGISGRGFQAFFQQLARRTEAEESAVGRYFARHPASGTRARFVAAQATGTAPAMSATEWQAVRRMCRR